MIGRPKKKKWTERRGGKMFHNVKQNKSLFSEAHAKYDRNAKKNKLFIYLKKRGVGETPGAQLT